MSIIDLEDARAHLNIRDASSAPDAKLQSMLDAVTGLIENEVGPIETRQESVLLDGGGYCVALPFTRVIALVSAVTIGDNSAVDVSGMFVKSGVLRRSDSGPLPLVPWRLQYTVGMSTVPEELRQGALETLALGWASQRKSGTDAMPAFLLSYRVLAWIKGQQIHIGFS